MKDLTVTLVSAIKITQKTSKAMDELNVPNKVPMWVSLPSGKQTGCY